ncbi:POZ domain-containing protein [Rozella allomycis CSF55]|uniref:Elongin-C n=1 Tax=Rozella allomycis (strain CSF55) TaxID=988480 RepID=A0A4V1J091_ROZAC|nr:POZ domain-containing protein [Rozella allomycis CSF55]
MASSGSSTVKLVSAEGFEFIIDRNAAMVSNTIKNILSSPGRFSESIQNEVHLKEIRAVVLDKVCQYCYYKLRHMNSTSEIPDFVIEPEINLELLMAADFLDM